MDSTTTPLDKRIYVCVTDNPVIVRGYANAKALTEGVSGYYKRCDSEAEAQRYFAEATGQPPPPILPPEPAAVSSVPFPTVSASDCVVTVETADGTLRKRPTASQIAALQNAGLWP